MRISEPPSPDELRSQAELEQYKAKLAVWVEAAKQQTNTYRERRQSRLDLAKLSHGSTIEFARGVFRGGMILNGGGSLATTTLIAATLQRSGSPVEGVSVLFQSLAIFAVGTLLPVLANGFSYFSQQHYSAAVSKASTAFKAGSKWRAAAIFCVWLSAACFVGGVCWTKVNFPAALLTSSSPSKTASPLPEATASKG